MIQYQCPDCEDTDFLEIAASVWVRLMQCEDENDDNIETDADEASDWSHEWDGANPMVCRACGFRGTVSDFEVKDELDEYSTCDTTP